MCLLASKGPVDELLLSVWSELNTYFPLSEMLLGLRIEAGYLLANGWREFY